MCSYLSFVPSFSPPQSDFPLIFVSTNSHSMKFLASWPLGCGVDIFYAKCRCLCFRSLFLPVQYFVISQFFLFSGFFFFTSLYPAPEPLFPFFPQQSFIFKTAALVLDSFPPSLNPLPPTSTLTRSGSQSCKLQQKCIPNN